VLLIQLLANDAVTSIEYSIGISIIHITKHGSDVTIRTSELVKSFKYNGKHSLATLKNLNVDDWYIPILQLIQI
jgi:hypothetical protein